MKKKIVKLLKEMEDTKGIKILFAVESGSRAWGMESKDSDYDVRFVFVRKQEDYNRLNPPHDVYQHAFDKDGYPCHQQGSMIDMVGFDIFKFVRMLSSSNPTTIEWLASDIVYYGKQNEIFKEFALTQHNPLALYHHYRSMCKNNYLKYLKTKDNVTYKRYLYAMRGLVNALFVKRNYKLPLINFPNTLKSMASKLPENVYDKLMEIIKLKKEGKEKSAINNIQRFDNHIESFLKETEVDIQPRKGILFKPLDEELHRLIKEYSQEVQYRNI